MKKTPLYKNHLKLKSHMVNFSGWSLPVMVNSIVEEHNAVRERAGLFDISHMGEILLEGKGATHFLQNLIPTNMNKLSIGSSMYSCFTLKSGGILDDFFIFQMAKDKFYLVVNASCIEEDLNHLMRNAPSTVKITDLSPQTAKIDIQGPVSKKIMSSFILDPRLDNLKRFEFIELKWEGVNLMICATGYTGESGYELFIEKGKASDLWESLLIAGKAEGLLPCGLGARDSLRLEACYSLYGHEISKTISPVEGGLGWLVSNPTLYPGKQIIETQKREKNAPREIIAFELTQRGIPREGYLVMLESQEVGIVTSGCFSPSLNKGIGLALVEKGSFAIDKPLTIMIRKKEIKAKRVKRPFISFNNWK